MFTPENQRLEDVISVWDGNFFRGHVGFKEGRMIKIMKIQQIKKVYRVKKAADP